MEKEIQKEMVKEKKCNHKRVYLYIIKSINIYECKYCKKRLEKDETIDKKILKRSFI